MILRKNISSGAPWEAIVGYSRAVKVDNQVFVAGTTAVDASGNIIGRGDAYKQTVEIFKKIEAALGESGARFEDVVRTRIFITDINDWEKIGKAHGEIFHTIRPAATIVEVKRLIHPDMLVEIEVDAVITG